MSASAIMKSPEDIAKAALKQGLREMRINVFGIWESTLIEEVAAAIREDRAEPVSEAEVMAALSVISREARIAMGRDFMRAALEAARKARADDAR